MKAELDLYNKVIEYLVVAPCDFARDTLGQVFHRRSENTLNYLPNSKAQYSRVVVKIDDFVGLLREITQKDEKCRNFF